MKIEATCDTCGRTFLLSQMGPDSDAPGRCPFCGARFARHYTGVLVESIDAAEAAAGHLVSVLSRLQSMEKGFRIDLSGMLANLTEEIQEHDARPAA